MSSTTLEADEMLCCASCGVAGVDDIKLKTCTACKLVRYCSVKCQKEHRPQHKRECKKRAAELRDEILFQQPESTHEGDCPICCLPLPIDPITKKSILMSCCSKVICHGCEYADALRELEGSLDPKCPFCRHPALDTQEEIVRHRMRRIEANDPVAMSRMGTMRYHEGNYKSAFHHYTKAAKLGDVGAHYDLSVMYREGQGVEKDEKMELYHLEQAAIGGHPSARNNLAAIEVRSDRLDRAVKHYIIAAKLGHDGSLKTVKECYSKGIISKEDFAAALRGHQAAIDATKSPQRDEAEAALQKLEATGAV